jgi:hypothetical protein
MLKLMQIKINCFGSDHDQGGGMGTSPRSFEAVEQSNGEFERELSKLGEACHVC